VGAAAADRLGKKSLTGWHRQHVDLALHLRISPKRLAGWEPLTYAWRDGDRWVIERETEWDEEQVMLLLAARELQTDIGSHGHPLAEAMSPLADPNRRGVGHHYEVPLPTIDYAAKALADAQDAYGKQYPDANQNGFMWGVKKVVDGPGPA
jgi:hypothetical protein